MDETSLDVDITESAIHNRQLHWKELFATQRPDANQFKDVLAGSKTKDIDLLFPWLLDHFPSAELIDLLLEEICRRYDDEEVSEELLRSRFEAALSCCGGDVLVGALLFQRFIEFEVDEHIDLLETRCGEISVSASKQRLLKLFHWQLSQPLVGLETALARISSILSDYFVESDTVNIKPELLKKNFDLALKRREILLLFEERIADSADTSTQSSNPLIETWKAYINVEKTDKNVPRVIRLYERALLQFPSAKGIWSEFVDFAGQLGDWRLLESVTRRAVQVIPDDVYIWKMHFMALESLYRRRETPRYVLEPSSDDAVTIDALTNAFQKPLSFALRSAEDYLDIILASLDFARRVAAKHTEKLQAGFHDNTVSDDVTSFDGVSDGVSIVATLRHWLKHAETFMELYYPDWLAGWLKLLKYCSIAERDVCLKLRGLLDGKQCHHDEHLSSRGDLSFLAPQIKSMWEKALKRFGKQYYFWKDYLAWVTEAAGDVDVEAVRKLFNRACNMVSDYNAEICADWVAFERQWGGISDIISVMIRVKDDMASRKEDVDANSLAADCSTKYSKKKERETSNNDATKMKNKRNEEEENSLRLGKRKTHHGSLPADSSVAHQISKRMRSEVSDTRSDLIAGHLPVGSDSVGDSGVCKDVSVGSDVEISNLPFTLDEAGIEAHVISLGCSELEQVILVLAKSGKPRGLACLHFRSAEAAILASERINLSSLGGRTIVARVIDSLPSIRTAEQVVGNTAAHHPTTVFVSKLPTSVTSETLRNFFSVCGEIVEAKIAVDKHTGESKGHALIQFTEEAHKRSALALNKRDLAGSRISVLPSKFAAVSEKPARSEPNASSLQTRDSSGFCSQRDEGAPREAAGAVMASTSHPANREDEVPKRKVKLGLGVLSFKPRQSRR